MLSKLIVKLKNILWISSQILYQVSTKSTNGAKSKFFLVFAAKPEKIGMEKSVIVCNDRGNLVNC